MKRHVILLSALLLSATAAGGAFAQSTGSATVSDVRFELIDLDPNDGIAPSVTFVADPESRSVADWSRRVLYYESDLKYTQPALNPVSITSSWTSPNPNTPPGSRIDLSASVLGGALGALTMQASAEALYTGGEFFASTRAWSGYVGFLLSPMTAMSVFADAAVHGTAGPLSAPGLVAGGAGGVWMQLGSAGSQQTPIVALSQTMQYGYDPLAELERTLTLGYSNTLATSSSHYLVLEAAATVSNSLLTDPPPPVPEPATHAMFAAGLGLLGAFGWRRRKPSRSR